MSNRAFKTHEFELPIREAISIVRLGGKALRKRRIKRTPESDPLAGLQLDVEVATVAIKCRLLDLRKNVFERMREPTRIPNVPYPLMNDKAMVVHVSRRFETEDGREFYVDCYVERIATVSIRNDPNPPDEAVFLGAMRSVERVTLDPCSVEPEDLGLLG